MIAHRFLLCGLLATALPGMAAADPEATLQVTATDPAPAGALHTDDAFALRVRYEATTAFRLRILGQWHGTTIAGTTHASPRYGPGHGDAIAWIAYPQATRLDRVFLAAEDAATGHVLASAALPVELTWREASGVPRTDPVAWVLNLNNAAQRAVAAEHPAAPQKPEHDGSVLAVQVVGLSIPGYLLLQLALPWFFRGGWRRAAWAPAWLMAPLFAFVLIATYGFDADRALLWLLLACPLLCLYFVMLTLLHWLKRNPA